MQLRHPQTDKDFQRYYHLRWSVLREPWRQPRGSERDALDADAIHLMITERDDVIAVGRLHFNSPLEAQIRYMAVEEHRRGRGAGRLLLEGLEQAAREGGASRIVLNARMGANRFYAKTGYQETGPGQTLYGCIRHVKMLKEL